MSHLVELAKEEVRACADIALNRWMMKWGSTDRPNYAGDNKKNMEPEIAANVRSIVAEYAVAKLYRKAFTFPFYTNEEHHFRKDIADVGQNIEVKSIRTRDEIPVFPKDLRDDWILVGAFVTDRDYYSTVKVYGWMHMSDVPEKAEWSVERDYNGKILRECWRVPEEAFEQGLLIPTNAGVSLTI